MTTVSYKLLAGVGIVVFLSACTAEPTRTEQDFGNSVRHMISMQKVPPPQTQPEISGVDGQQAERILKTYREDISKPKEIKNEIQINVGN